MPAYQSTLCAGVGRPDCSRSKWSIGTDHGTIERAPNARNLSQKEASRKIAAVSLCAAGANLRDLWAPLTPTVDILYPSNIKNRPTPIGAWRPDIGRAIQRAIPSVQAHQNIERAWLLHKRHLWKKWDAEVARKFECMKEAMDELYKLDPKLYLEANRSEDPRARSKAEMELMKTLKMSEMRTLAARIWGLFPRELRIPTDTPARTGWNYEWKPFPRPI